MVPFRGRAITQNIRVLIVEDAQPWREFVFSTVQEITGLDVVEVFSDGPEAIEKLIGLRPDLVLLDIGLPTMNGIEVARRIREVSPASKIIFVSENRSSDIVEGALSTGAEGYVVKSDAAGELLPAIKAVLKGKRFISGSVAGQLLVATGLINQSISWILTLILGMS